MGNRNKSRARVAREFVEYGLVRLGSAFVDLLPSRAAHLLAGLLADSAFLLARRRRRIAIGNLRYTGVAPDEPTARRIARASFRHFGHMMVELNKFMNDVSDGSLREMVELEAPAETMDLLEDDSRGVLLLSAHIGNWELAGLRFALSKRTLVIAKKAKNKRVQRFLETRQVRPLLEVVDKRSVDLRRLAREMQKGAAVGMLVDQHARDTTGMQMNVFGKPAAVHTSPAVLYKLSRVPIVFFKPIVTGRSRIRLTLSEPLQFDTSGNRGATVERVMGRYIEWFENAVRNNPEQYLWAHRRWRGDQAPR